MERVAEITYLGLMLWSALLMLVALMGIVRPFFRDQRRMEFVWCGIIAALLLATAIGVAMAMGRHFSIFYLPFLPQVYLTVLSSVAASFGALGLAWRVFERSRRRSTQNLAHPAPSRFNPLPMPLPGPRWSLRHFLLLAAVGTTASLALERFDPWNMNSAMTTVIQGMVILYMAWLGVVLTGIIHPHRRNWSRKSYACYAMALYLFFLGMVALLQWLINPEPQHNEAINPETPGAFALFPLQIIAVGTLLAGLAGAVGLRGKRRRWPRRWRWLLRWRPLDCLLLAAISAMAILPRLI